MTIIADCGGTKGDWAIVRPDGAVSRMQTGGVNPFHQAEADSQAQLSAVASACQRLLTPGEQVDIYYYGAGCNAAGTPLMRTLLSRAFDRVAPTLYIYSDLLGAARSLCQHAEGVACILGTGSNSCLYDGASVVANTPPLGYILGDEGSGADLGKHFLHALLKGQLPQTLYDEFMSAYHTSYAQLLQRVYRQPGANSFLASVVPFIHAHMDNALIEELVVSRFRAFLCCNVRPYRRPDLPIHFVGGVAAHFEPQLRRAIEAEHLLLGQISQTPMDGMLAYHGYAPWRG